MYKGSSLKSSFSSLCSLTHPGTHPIESNMLHRGDSHNHDGKHTQTVATRTSHTHAQRSIEVQQHIQIHKKSKSLCIQFSHSIAIWFSLRLRVHRAYKFSLITLWHYIHSLNNGPNGGCEAEEQAAAATAAKIRQSSVDVQYSMKTTASATSTTLMSTKWEIDRPLLIWAQYLPTFPNLNAATRRRKKNQ